MRWLFVGEALVLRKEQRILVFIVLNHLRGEVLLLVRRAQTQRQSERDC